MTGREEAIDKKSVSLRERLKQQAEAAREAERRRSLANAEAERLYEIELLPCMLAAVEYFEGVVADLNTIGEPLAAVFPIGPSDARDVKLRQHDYSLLTDDQYRPREITVNCVCELTTPVIRHVANARDGDGIGSRAPSTRVSRSASISPSGGSVF